ncbi:MAG: DNA methyltransferase [bacterium]|nr:DNA methyltransferase [bacterium]
MGNYLYYGDNLDILRRYVADETVDLVYLDPPFNSNVVYSAFFAEKNGTRAAAQIKAFEDTWTWNVESEATYAELVTAGGKVSDALQGFRRFLGECDMLAYLAMMAPRLVELRRVLKPTGSLYLHCDPTASHYLKMLMDAVFGAKQFRNEITWCYTGAASPGQRYFNRKHDVVFWYSRGEEWTFNPYVLEIPFAESTRRRAQHVDGSFGKTRSKPLPEWKFPDDWWADIIALKAGKERLGYPTQKPEALLERIIEASSNEGNLVLDPFCGCGTTVAVAQRLNRRWIGIDITHLAVTLIKNRLQNAFGAAVAQTYQPIGEPTSLPDAATLAESDPYQFQWWALGLVGARPVEQKKGADKGIDGKIIFQGEKTGEFETVILSVKAGKTGSAHVRDLKGVVLGRKDAAIGVLISMQEPTRDMKTEAATAGFYESATWGRKYPKIQLLTVAELLAGKQIDMPPLKQVGATFKKAPKVQKREPDTESMI